MSNWGPKSLWRQEGKVSAEEVNLKDRARSPGPQEEKGTSSLVEHKHLKTKLNKKLKFGTAKAHQSPGIKGDSIYLWHFLARNPVEMAVIAVWVYLISSCLSPLSTEETHRTSCTLMYVQIA